MSEMYQPDFPEDAPPGSLFHDQGGNMYFTLEGEEWVNIARDEFLELNAVRPHGLVYVAPRYEVRELDAANEV